MLDNDWEYDKLVKEFNHSPEEHQRLVDTINGKYKPEPIPELTITEQIEQAYSKSRFKDYVTYDEFKHMYIQNEMLLDRLNARFDLSVVNEAKYVLEEISNKL